MDEDGYIRPSRVVFALPAPNLETEDTPVVIPVDGAQPEVDSTQEEIGSQPENVNTTEDRTASIYTHRVEPSRVSSRLVAQHSVQTRVEDMARSNVAARNLEGTNLNSSNSFAVLDNDDISSRMLEMGVDPASFNLDNIDYMKDLEVARHNIENKKKEVVANASEANKQVAPLGWREEDGGDNDGFTPIISRRKRKASGLLVR